MGWKRAEGPALEARRTREERVCVRKLFRMRSCEVVSGGEVEGVWLILTCHENGRLLRFRRAKRMARSFQMPPGPDRPTLLRNDATRLRLGVHVDMAK